MKTLLLLGVLIFLSNTVLSQSSKLHLDYSFIGLGSNRFKTFPSVTIDGQKLVYEKKHGKRIQYITNLRADAWDSIEQIINLIKDSTVERINPCILSGGIYRLNVVANSKTVHFSLSNTFDSAAYKIVNILNESLPQKYKLGIPFRNWQNEQVCIDKLRRRMDSAQRQTSGVQQQISKTKAEEQ